MLSETLLQELFDFHNGYADKAYRLTTQEEPRCFLRMTASPKGDRSKYFYFFRKHLVTTYDNEIFEVIPHSLTVAELSLLKLSQFGYYEDMSSTLERIYQIRDQLDVCVITFLQKEKKALDTEHALLAYDKKRLQKLETRLKLDMTFEMTITDHKE